MKDFLEPEKNGCQYWNRSTEITGDVGGNPGENLQGVLLIVCGFGVSLGFFAAQSAEVRCRVRVKAKNICCIWFSMGNIQSQEKLCRFLRRRHELF